MPQHYVTFYFQKINQTLPPTIYVASLQEAKAIIGSAGKLLTSSWGCTEKN